MSYRLDLDEMDEVMLKNEISRRQKLREEMLCDYCERAPSTPSCKFPKRHAAPVPCGVFGCKKSIAQCRRDLPEGHWG